jgi:hypothetical protein
MPEEDLWVPLVDDGGVGSLDDLEGVEGGLVLD